GPPVVDWFLVVDRHHLLAGPAVCAALLDLAPRLLACVPATSILFWKTLDAWTGSRVWCLRASRSDPRHLPNNVDKAVPFFKKLDLCAPECTQTDWFSR